MKAGQAPKKAATNISSVKQYKTTMITTWRNDRCEAIVAIEESVGQLGTVYPELSKPQLRLLARFAEFLKRQKSGELLKRGKTGRARIGELD